MSDGRKLITQLPWCSQRWSLIGTSKLKFNMDFESLNHEIFVEKPSKVQNLDFYFILYISTIGNQSSLKYDNYL